MSWNLLIYKDDASGKIVDLGDYSKVRALISESFPAITWVSADECSLEVYRGFRLQLTISGAVVSDIFTHGGYDHLREFAKMCKDQDWKIVDAQEGRELDLEDPYKGY